MNLERRAINTEFEFRARPAGGAVVRGYAAVFDSLSQNLGGFVERIDPGAFTKTLADNPDVRALINHDPSAILGRTRSGTLRLGYDTRGMHYEVDMPDRQDARDLMVSMERGDVTQSSFGFSVPKNGDVWDYTEEGYPLRTIRAVNMNNGDVSPVTYPAYTEASSSVERAYRSLAAHFGADLDRVQAAAAANDLRSIMAPIAIEQPVETEQRATHSEPEWLVRARRLYR